ncbi:hypothetical protein DQ04_12491000 [Trypanosoma grayi]|uniref:hypothetical protein n=1 Tax=Trypanosoma grayi TaxID=71804 RepID=UPI0004F4B64F|nr:hypothetical protein DQ04_12491000 [Trypanosoma grayi]KEG06741.1 hypothetical protein DQ04_12491000 [Trypanosoma grayi]
MEELQSELEASRTCERDFQAQVRLLEAEVSRVASDAKRVQGVVKQKFKGTVSAVNEEYLDKQPDEPVGTKSSGLEPVSLSCGVEMNEFRHSIEELLSELEALRKREKEYEEQHYSMKKLYLELEELHRSSEYLESELESLRRSMEGLQVELEASRHREKEFEERSCLMVELQAEVEVLRQREKEFEVQRQCVEEMKLELEALRQREKEFEVQRQCVEEMKLELEALRQREKEVEVPRRSVAGEQGCNAGLFAVEVVRPSLISCFPEGEISRQSVVGGNQRYCDVLSGSSGGVGGVTDVVDPTWHRRSLYTEREEGSSSFSTLSEGRDCSRCVVLARRVIRLRGTVRVLKETIRSFMECEDTLRASNAARVERLEEDLEAALMELKRKCLEE